MGVSVKFFPSEDIYWTIESFADLVCVDHLNIWIRMLLEMTGTLKNCSRLSKKDTNKKNSNIGVGFLTDQLIDVQVKLMELDNHHESRYVEYETGELMKQQKWSSTVVKVGDVSFTLFRVAIIFWFLWLYMSSIFSWPEFRLYMPSIFSWPEFPLMFFEICTGGTGNEPSETNRMVGKKKCGDCVMVHFYKKGSLKKNGSSWIQIDSMIRHPILVQQQPEMQMPRTSSPFPLTRWLTINPCY